MIRIAAIALTLSLAGPASAGALISFDDPTAANRPEPAPRTNTCPSGITYYRWTPTWACGGAPHEGDGVSVAGAPSEPVSAPSTPSEPDAGGYDCEATD